MAKNTLLIHAIICYVFAKPKNSQCWPDAARECVFCNSIQKQQTTDTEYLLRKLYVWCYEDQCICISLADTPIWVCAFNTNIKTKTEQQQKERITCNAFGQRQLSWCAVVISLLCAVAAVVPLIPPTPPPFTSDSSGAAISVDTVGHILYPSGLIAQATKRQFTVRKR